MQTDFLFEILSKPQNPGLAGVQGLYFDFLQQSRDTASSSE